MDLNNRFCGCSQAVLRGGSDVLNDSVLGSEVIVLMSLVVPGDNQGHLSHLGSKQTQGTMRYQGLKWGQVSIPPLPAFLKSYHKGHQLGAFSINSAFRLHTSHLIFPLLKALPILQVCFSQSTSSQQLLKNELLCICVLFKGIFSWCTDPREQVEAFNFYINETRKTKGFSSQTISIGP